MISNKKIIKIRDLHSLKWPVRKIAKRVGVSPTTVNEYINPKKESYRKRICDVINNNNKHLIELYNNSHEQNKQNPSDIDQFSSSELAGSLQEQIDQIDYRMDHFDNEFQDQIGNRIDQFDNKFQDQIDQINNRIDKFDSPFNPIRGEIDELTNKIDYDSNEKIDQFLRILNPICNKIDQIKNEQTLKNIEIENKFQETDKKQVDLEIKQLKLEKKLQEYEKKLYQIETQNKYNQNNMTKIQSENQGIKFKLNTLKDDKKNVEQKQLYMRKTPEEMFNEELAKQFHINPPAKKIILGKQNSEPLDEKKINITEKETHENDDFDVTPFYSDPYFWKDLMDNLKKKFPCLIPNYPKKYNPLYNNLKIIPIPKKNLS